MKNKCRKCVYIIYEENDTSSIGDNDKLIKLSSAKSVAYTNFQGAKFIFALYTKFYTKEQGAPALDDNLPL